MNDKEFERSKKRIQKYFTKWLTPMGLAYWDIQYRFHRVPLASSGINFDQIGTACTPMLTHCHWQYLNVMIDIDVEQCSYSTDEELEMMVVHELCHGLINEMREYRSGKGVRHEERVATQLAKAFCWVRKAGEGKLKVNYRKQK